MKHKEIDISYLRESFFYDSDSGAITWKIRPLHHFYSSSTMKRANAMRAGKEVTSLRQGYVAVWVKGVSIYGHRIAWALHYGEWPNGDIDHINHNRQDNRIENLRLVEHIENTKNASLSKNNTSGINGVGQHRGRWRAQLGSMHIGLFDTIEEAVAARTEAERCSGYHPNHGI